MKRNYEQPFLTLSVWDDLDVITSSPVKDSWTEVDPEWGTIGEGA